jgi:hypothetical protein
MHYSASKKSSGVWAGHYFTHSEMGLEQVAFPSASHSCIKAFPGPSILGSVIVFPGHGHQQIWWDLSFHGYGAESLLFMSHPGLTFGFILPSLALLYSFYALLLSCYRFILGYPILISAYLLFVHTPFVPLVAFGDGVCLLSFPTCMHPAWSLSLLRRCLIGMRRGICTC